jgi:hypothetical protein
VAEEDLVQLVVGVVREVQQHRQPGPQPGVAVHQLAHRRRVAGEDDHQVVAVVLHQLGQDRQRLVAVVLPGRAGHQRMRLVDEQHAAERPLDDGLHLGRGLADVLADQVGPGDLDQVAGRQHAALAVDPGQQPGHGRLAGARVAGEHHVPRPGGDRHPGLGPQPGHLRLGDQLGHPLLDRLQPDQLGQLRLGIRLRPVLRLPGRCRFARLDHRCDRARHRADAEDVPDVAAEVRGEVQVLGLRRPPRQALQRGADLPGRGDPLPGRVRLAELGRPGQPGPPLPAPRLPVDVTGHPVEVRLDGGRAGRAEIGERQPGRQVDPADLVDQPGDVGLEPFLFLRGDLDDLPVGPAQPGHPPDQQVERVVALLGERLEHLGIEQLALPQPHQVGVREVAVLRQQFLVGGDPVPQLGDDPAPRLQRGHPFQQRERLAVELDQPQPQLRLTGEGLERRAGLVLRDVAGRPAGRRAELRPLHPVVADQQRRQVRHGAGDQRHRAGEEPDQPAERRRQHRGAVDEVRLGPVTGQPPVVERRILDELLDLLLGPLQPAVRERPGRLGAEHVVERRVGQQRAQFLGKFRHGARS